MDIAHIVLESLTLLVTFFGFVIAILKLNTSNKIKRAEFLNGILDKYKSSKDIVSTVYMIDYDETEWYTKNFHTSDNRKSEIKIDNTMYYFDYICYLINNGMISKKEIEFFEYDLMNIKKDPQIKNYFYNVYHYAKSRSCCPPFVNLMNYCGLMEDKDFMDKDSYNKKDKMYSNYIEFEYKSK